jgi:nickel transport system substrate-binding protein
MSAVSETRINHTLELVIKESDPEMNAVKEYLVEDLAKIGIDLKIVALDSESYIEKERNGEFNMLFGRTWGAPYDPHSYLESWETPSHVEFSVLGGMEAPTTSERLLEKIEEVQGELEEANIQAKYADILSEIHQQATFRIMSSADASRPPTRPTATR